MKLLDRDSHDLAHHHNRKRRRLRWAFAFLAPGPALGVLAMLRLKSLPEATRIAGDKG